MQMRSQSTKKNKPGFGISILSSDQKYEIQTRILIFNQSGLLDPERVCVSLLHNAFSAVVIAQ